MDTQDWRSAMSISWTPEELAEMAAADAEIDRTFEITTSEIKEINQRDPKKERSKNAIAAAKWYAKNREKILPKRRKYYQEHRDEILAKARAKYHENPEAKRQADRARYYERIEEYRAKGRERYRLKKEAKNAEESV